MQQINLFTFVPKPPKSQINFRQFISLLGGFSLILCLYTTYVNWRYHQTENEFLAKKVEIEQTEKKMTVLLEKNPQLLAGMKLEDSISQLADEVKLRAALREKYFKDRDRKLFSDYLVALTRVIPAGLWLRLIQIDHQQQAIIFSGKSVSPSLVPEFIQSLRQSPSFSGANFKTFYLEKAEENKSLVDFTIGAPQEELQPKKELKPNDRKTS